MQYKVVINTLPPQTYFCDANTLPEAEQLVVHNLLTPLDPQYQVIAAPVAQPVMESVSTPKPKRKTK